MTEFTKIYKTETTRIGLYVEQRNDAGVVIGAADLSEIESLEVGFKRSLEDDDHLIFKSVGDGVEVLNQITDRGWAVCTLSPGDTESLDAGTMWWDAVLVKDGSRDFVVTPRLIKLLDVVTPGGVSDSGGSILMAPITATVAFGGQVADPLRSDNGLWVPSSQNQFEALGIGGQWSGLWLCQEGSGDLEESIGTLPLVAHGAPLYQQSRSGFRRKFVTLAEVNGDAFRLDSASISPVGQSVAWLALFFVTASAAQRLLMTLGSTSVAVGGGGVFLRVNTSGRINIVANGTVTTGTTDYRDGIPRYMLVTLNALTSQLKVRTLNATTGAILETITSSVYPAVVTNANTKGLGSSSASNAPPACGFGMVAAAEGAEAESLDADATLLALVA